MMASLERLTKGHIQYTVTKMQETFGFSSVGVFNTCTHADAMDLTCNDPEDNPGAIYLHGGQAYALYDHPPSELLLREGRHKIDQGSENVQSRSLSGNVLMGLSLDLC